MWESITSRKINIWNADQYQLSLYLSTLSILKTSDHGTSPIIIYGTQGLSVEFAFVDIKRFIVISLLVESKPH